VIVDIVDELNKFQDALGRPPKFNDTTILPMRAAEVIQAQREYIERLEVALKKIAEGEVRTTHKIDKCSHGAYGYENCDMCYIEFAEQALASKPKDI
jgi:hypothetical protein